MDTWEESEVARDRLGYDLVTAIQYNSPGIDVKEIESILLELTGVNDERGWHWIVKLYDGGFAYIEGSCDYTGWDCQSNCTAHKAHSFDGALLEVPESHRGEFIDMYAKGETVRAARSDW